MGGYHHNQLNCPNFALVLALYQIQIGLLNKAEDTLDKALGTFERTEKAKLIKASIVIQWQNFPKKWF